MPMSLATVKMFWTSLPQRTPPILMAQATRMMKRARHCVVERETA
jgi:hypothetical protein